MSNSASSNAGRIKSGSGGKKDKQTTNGHQHNKKGELSSSDDDDEPLHAPIQLKIEVKKID